MESGSVDSGPQDRRHRMETVCSSMAWWQVWVRSGPRVRAFPGTRAGGMWSIGGVSEWVMRDGVSLRVDRVRAVEWGVSEGH